MSTPAHASPGTCNEWRVRPGSHGVIEVRLRELSQLFDAMDPSPFGERDLERHAENYIVESAREPSFRRPRKLIIYLDHSIARPNDARAAGDAIRIHFARRARLLKKELQQLIHRGFVSLGIGTGFLTVFFIFARLVNRWMGEGGAATLLGEGLMIVGWVAMWRPLEIFLYDWWPILGAQRMHERLSQVEVQFVARQSAQSWIQEAI